MGWPDDGHSHVGGRVRPPGRSSCGWQRLAWLVRRPVAAPGPPVTPGCCLGTAGRTGDGELYFFDQPVMSGFILVTKTLSPPTRLEGGGFQIRDIMSGVTTEEQDPFLVRNLCLKKSLSCVVIVGHQIWHELPRKYQKKGEFPGAPMHCHRGFSELPYCKEISGGNSDQYGYFIAKDHTGATCKVGSGRRLFSASICLSRTLLPESLASFIHLQILTCNTHRRGL